MAGLSPSLVDNGKVDLERVEIVRLPLEVSDPVVNRLLNHRVVVDAMRKGRSVAFQQVLVDPEILVKDPQGGFESPGNLVQLRWVQAFVVHAARGKHHQQIAAFGQKRALVDGSVNIHERVHGAGFLVVLKDAAVLNHGGGSSGKGT